MDEQSVFSPPYRLELLCRAAPLIDANALGRALSARLGDVSRSGGEPDLELHFTVQGNVVALPGGAAPARLVFRQVSGAVDEDSRRAALDQSWDVDDAAANLADCCYSVSMTNIAASALPERQRRKIVAGGLLAMLDVVGAQLVYFPQSGQMLDPGKVRSKLAEPGQMANPAYGFVNVRLFNVEGGGTHVMDTLGLGALGLTDLQIHFRRLEVAPVADLLYSLAAYLLENGDVIDNGHTVPGIRPGDHWTCIHEMALVAPDRLVLDIDPGAPFAGNGPG